MILSVLILGNQIVLIEKFESHYENIRLVQSVSLKQILGQKEKVETRYHMLSLFERVLLSGYGGEVGKGIVRHAVFDWTQMIAQYILIKLIVT